MLDARVTVSRDSMGTNDGGEQDSNAGNQM
jgi:hypothetical protein